MNKMMIVGLIAASLAGCGSEPAPAPKEEAPKSLTAGEYELTGKVTMLQASDKAAPATALKKDESYTRRACVAADGSLDPKMFVAEGDSCTATSSFVRAGRISVQYQCSRPGKGNVFPNVDGNYKADSFEAIITTGTSFSGTGDYQLTERVSAKRVGDCPAA